MSKTTENRTKPTKTAKTTKKTTPKNTTAKNTQTKGFSIINTTQTPIELFRNLASKSIYFSLGLGAYLLDGRQNLKDLQKVKVSSLRSDFTGNVNKFINNTIHKGEKREKDTTETIKSFEQTQRNRVKQLFVTPKPKIQKAETNLEDKIEEVIATLDLPTRDELQKLNHRLTELSRELQRQHNTNNTIVTKLSKPTSTKVKSETVKTPVNTEKETVN